MGLTKEPSIPQAISELALSFYEPQLATLGLASDQVLSQGIDELKFSLATIDDAIKHPESFGTLKVALVGRGELVVVPASTPDALLEISALPTLLARKTQILQRISLLRPQEQLSDLRE